MSPTSRGRFRRGTAAGCTALLVGSLTSACFAEPSALPAVRDFLIAWQVGNYQAAARHTTGDRAAVAKALQAVPRQLDAVSLKLGMRKITKVGEQADARFSVKVDLGENGDPWEYQSQMHLRRVKGTWKIDWSPSVIHPNLRQGGRLAIVTESPQRAAILDTAGKSLLKTVPVEIVGVTPGWFTDDTTLKSTMTALAADTGLDVERLIGRVRSAPPKTFLPLLTLRQPEEASLAARLRRIPGLQSRPGKAPIEAAVAPELVGKLGSATAERLQQVGAPYQPGDTIGASGMQLIFQRRLAGIPTVRAVAVDAQGRIEMLREWSGVAPETVRTTLDRRSQVNAETSLKNLPVPASIAAVHAPTGQVLAVANHLTNGQELALAGSFAPGMAFSIVSAEALLANGFTTTSRTNCPRTTTIGDQTIANLGKGYGEAPLITNFALSCPTAFGTLGNSLTKEALGKEVDKFGLGKNWGQPIPMFSGAVPPPGSDAEKALTMIGQGRVRMSPLAMALAAGAAGSGTWRPPLLFHAPVVAQTVQPQPLDSTPVQQLRSLMRRSVSQGAARKANIPGTVYGVSSSVTYTEGGTQKTLSWFVGFRSDIACAIVVQGKVDAALVAASFLGRFRG